MRIQQKHLRFNLSLLLVLSVALSLCCGCTAKTKLPFSEQHYDREFNGKYGYINSLGNFTIPPRFDSAEPFSSGLAFVNDSGKLGYIDHHGSMKFSVKAAVAGTFSGDLALFQSTYDSKFGYINKLGKFAIEPIFASAHDFNEGLASVAASLTRGVDDPSSLYGIIDTNGQYVVKPQFLYCRGFSDGFAVARLKSGKMTFVDHAGKYPTTDLYDECLPYTDGMALVAKGGKWSAIGKDFRPAVHSQFDAALDDFRCLKQLLFADSGPHTAESQKASVICRFTEGLAAVKLNGAWGYIDKNGKLIIPPSFAEANHFSEGLASVKIGNKYGFINKLGKVIIPPKFDTTSSFHEGLARIDLGDKVGYINKTGVLQIQPRFDIAGDFSEGLALVGVGPWINSHRP